MVQFEDCEGNLSETLHTHTTAACHADCTIWTMHLTTGYDGGICRYCSVNWQGQAGQAGRARSCISYWSAVYDSPTEEVARKTITKYCVLSSVPYTKFNAVVRDPQQIYTTSQVHGWAIVSILPRTARTKLWATSVLAGEDVIQKAKLSACQEEKKRKKNSLVLLQYTSFLPPLSPIILGRGSSRRAFSLAHFLAHRFLFNEQQWIRTRLVASLHTVWTHSLMFSWILASH